MPRWFVKFVFICEHINILWCKKNRGSWLNKNLAVANRSRVSCAHVDGIYSNPVILKSRLMVTRGHWKRNHWTDHARLTISRVIILFDVEYYRDLEMWVRGHSRSLKLVPFESSGEVSCSPSTMWYCNYGAILYHLYSAKLMRWALALQEFQVEFKYWKG